MNRMLKNNNFCKNNCLGQFCSKISGSLVHLLSAEDEKSSIINKRFFDSKKLCSWKIWNWKVIYFISFDLKQSQGGFDGKRSRGRQSGGPKHRRASPKRTSWPGEVGPEFSCQTKLFEEFIQNWGHHLRGGDGPDAGQSSTKQISLLHRLDADSSPNVSSIFVLSVGPFFKLVVHVHRSGPPRAVLLLRGP